MATRLLPVDESLVFSENIYYENRVFNNQGFKFFFPNLKNTFIPLYTTDLIQRFLKKFR